MKKSILAVALMALAGIASAQVTVQRNEFGTGTPGINAGSEPANEWAENSGIYFVPQYLPGYPTSATIWPRVIDVDCVANGTGRLACKGFNWLPEMGRAEYLMVRPRLVQPVVQQQPKIIERTIIKEVPRKNKGE
jgi:hypothetical protein